MFISDKHGKKGLVIEATTMDTEVSFNNVMVTDDIVKEKTVHRFERQLRTYPGPDFSTLDERIQSSVTELL